ncbi:hypothetical protein FRC12_004991 [Ceratobasidium sp. 428]|nr:hypothetical protein FRC12_004991 [Ceratobasidium sp. 428]
MNDLITQLPAQLAAVSTLLDQVADADYTDGLDPAATNVVGGLLGKNGGLSDLSRKVTKARSTLTEVNKKRKGRKDTGKRPKKVKESPELAGIKFWNETFIEKLTDISSVELDSEDFFKKLMEKKKGTISDDVAVGLELVMQGVGEVTRDEVGEFLENSSADQVLSNALTELQGGQIDELGKDELAAIFMSTSSESALQKRSYLSIYQNMFSSMSAVQYSIRWSLYNKQKHPNKAKQEVLDATFRKKEKIGPEEMVDPKSEEFEDFKCDHERYLRGANRLACAYQEATLVLICPQLCFAYFQNAEVGGKLSKTVKKLAETVGKDEARERGHRALIQSLIEPCECEELQQAYNHLEEAIETHVPEESESDGE